MEKKRKATKGQRERIDGMLRSGLIDYAEAQALIHKNRDQSTAKQQQRERRALEAERLAFWELHYPSEGKALMEILRPFYGWQPVLKPALPDLQERVKLASFWNSVRIHEFSPETKKVGVFPGRVLFVSWWDLPFAIRDSWGEHRRLFDSTFAPLLWAPLSAVLGDSLAANALASLINTLTALFLRMSGRVDGGGVEAVAKFKALLDLWLAGNFPMGLDSKDDLIVFVSAT